MAAIPYDAAEFVRHCAESIGRSPDTPSYIVYMTEGQDGRLEQHGKLVYAPAGVDIEAWLAEKRQSRAARRAAWEAEYPDQKGTA